MIFLYKGIKNVKQGISSYDPIIRFYMQIKYKTIIYYNHE